MEWQSIDSAPKKPTTRRGVNGPMILLASARGHFAVGYWGLGRRTEGNKSWINIHDHMPMDYGKNFTHWLPLPPPPTGEQE